MKLLNRLDNLNIKLHSLVILRNLLSNDVIKKLSELLTIKDKSPIEQVSCYSSFVNHLFNENINLSDYILDLILHDENIFIMRQAQRIEIDDNIKECIINELKILEEISQLTSKEVKNLIKYDSYLPSWKNSKRTDFYSIYMEKVENLSTLGYGIYSKHHIFSLTDNKISPILNPDNIRLSDLFGYNKERKAVVDNTLSFLSGKPAANVLLYGDSGTGKSSTVKAIANEFKEKGLRLIEISRDNLQAIPIVIDEISKNPLKFILFIDDISFQKNNKEFGVLKSLLEGSASSKSPNLLVYATSNRKHLIKENFSERDGDDIHINETIQETVSLSERFGLSVYFSRPNKEEYLMIVNRLAKQYKIDIKDQELNYEAERYALLRNGRSPRIARQFIENLKGKALN